MHYVCHIANQDHIDIAHCFQAVNACEGVQRRRGVQLALAGASCTLIRSVQTDWHRHSQSFRQSASLNVHDPEAATNHRRMFRTVRDSRLRQLPSLLHSRPGWPTIRCLHG